MEETEMAKSRFSFAAVVVLAASLQAACAEDPHEPAKLVVPAGFNIEVLVDDVPNARSMALGDQGTLFVSTRKLGKVYAVTGLDSADGPVVTTVADGMNVPNGVAFHDGALYVAEISRVLRFPGIESRLDEIPTPEVVRDDFPTDGHHGWKYIAFGPDGKLYVPIGAPCNVCDEAGYAVIMRMNADGSGLEVFAEGVRNSVGFTWHPDTGEMWFTDNGRDWMGDDIPDCELNHAPRAGMHFGFPYCHGGDIVDPEYGDSRKCGEFTPPALGLGAHVAPLGIEFYTGAMVPAEYRGQAFIAEHGSWNREAGKVGYQVVLVRMKDGRAVGKEPFAYGWLAGDEVSGRPVDVLQLADGSLLVSDDLGGRIYRITYRGG
jgi:glucose/arabinose dehydrogenase